MFKVRIESGPTLGNQPQAWIAPVSDAEMPGDLPSALEFQRIEQVCRQEILPAQGQTSIEDRHRGSSETPAVCSIVAGRHQQLDPSRGQLDPIGQVPGRTTQTLLCLTGVDQHDQSVDGMSVQLLAQHLNNVQRGIGLRVQRGVMREKKEVTATGSHAMSDKAHQ
ncbi:hypothetical protein [Nocardia brasiliensis]|uniref:hypothetical protein n=1 Tax=Nocardia brasiliensis TaxID=37326 RepID=UPI0024584B89|nr:hypothetical protein [Nocardia brasiliensis]